MSNTLNELYKSVDSIKPIYWGKCGWKFLNSIALTYKPEYKDNYKLFFLQLQYILPCEECGLDIKNSMHLLDDALKSKESLLLWLMNIRNNIYIKQNRPIKTLTDNLNEIYKLDNTNTLVQIILYVCILLIIVFIYYYLPSFYSRNKYKPYNIT
jgi:hypothetical protein